MPSCIGAISYYHQPLIKKFVFLSCHLTPSSSLLHLPYLYHSAFIQPIPVVLPILILLITLLICEITFVPLFSSPQQGIIATLPLRPSTLVKYSSYHLPTTRFCNFSLILLFLSDHFSHIYFFTALSNVVTSQQIH